MGDWRKRSQLLEACTTEVKQYIHHGERASAELKIEITDISIYNRNVLFISFLIISSTTTSLKYIDTNFKAIKTTTSTFQITMTFLDEFQTWLKKFFHKIIDHYIQ